MLNQTQPRIESGFLNTPNTLVSADVVADSSAFHSGSKNIGYFERLDHLRFLAAALIILHHAVPAWIVAIHHTGDFNLIATLGDSFGKFGRFTNGLISEGHTAAALFMTLSAFLFARISDGRNIEYKGFFLNRVLRIYPLFTCVLLLAIYLMPAQNGVLALLSSLLCMHNISNSVMHPLVTPHLWSIAVEFQFYLLFPFLLTFGRTRGKKYLGLLLVAAIVCRAMVYAYTHDVRNLAYMTLFGRIDQFIIGMLLGLSYPRFERFIRNPVFLAGASVAAITALSIFHAKGGFYLTERKAIWIFWTPIEAILWGGVIASYCACSVKLPKVLSRSLSFLGMLSFSLYVNHYFLANLIPKIVVPWLEKLSTSGSSTGFLAVSSKYVLAMDYWSCIVLTLFLVIPVTVLVSILTYYAIEKPFMDMRVKYTTCIGETAA